MKIKKYLIVATILFLIGLVIWLKESAVDDFPTIVYIIKRFLSHPLFYFGLASLTISLGLIRELIRNRENEESERKDNWI